MRKSILFILVFIFSLFGHYLVHCQNNQNNGNNQQSQPNQNISISEPVTKVSLEPNQEEIEAERGYKKRQEQRDNSNALWNKTAIVINSLLFILVLIQSLLSYRSLKVIREQAASMETQSVAMKDQNDIMVEQSKTMNGQLEFMEKQTQVMQETLDTTQESIKQNERAIKSSQRQAKISETALEITKESFYISERAYIGVVSIFPEPMPIVKGEQFRIWCEIINTGKTPANNLKHMFGVAFEYIEEYERIRPKLPSVTQEGADHHLFAGMHTALRGLWMNISDEQYENVHTAQTMRLVVIGEIKYKCLNDREESLKFEYAYDAESGTFIQLGGTFDGKPTIEMLVDEKGNKISQE